MSNWKNRFLQWMQGRYGGNDTLNKCLFGLFLALLLISVFMQQNHLLYSIFNVLAFAVLVFAYFRIFSRNIEKRQAENEKFLQCFAIVRDFFTGKNRSTTSRIFQCPECGQKVRVPKGKGKIEITCPKCNGRFIKRS